MDGDWPERRAFACVARSLGFMRRSVWALVVLALHLVGIVVAADVLARGYASEQTLFVRLEPKWSSYASAIGDSDARVTADAQRLVMRLRADPAVAGVAHGPPVIADEHMPVDIVTALQRGRGVHIVADANYPDVVGLTRRTGRGFEVSSMAPTSTSAGRFSGELAPAVPALI